MRNCSSNLSSIQNFNVYKIDLEDSPDINDDFNVDLDKRHKANKEEKSSLKPICYCKD